MHRLDRLSIDDLIECSSAFRGISSAAASLEDAAQEITRYLHHHLVDGEGAPACPLVRLYKTHRYDGLGPELQAFARAAAEDDVEADTRCLTLLGTSGDLPEWNDRARSLAHRAIPLVSVEVVEQSPMIASLIRGMGLDVADVVSPDARAGIALHHRDYDLFFVPEAEASPFVPAQRDFVVPWAIRSVVGCGGMLPSSDLFALIVFSRLPLSEETADLFRTLALSVKATIVPYTFNVFAEG